MFSFLSQMSSDSIIHFAHFPTFGLWLGNIMNVPPSRDRGCQHVNIPLVQRRFINKIITTSDQQIVPFTASGSVWVRQNGRLYPCHSTQKVFWSSSDPVPSLPDRAEEAASLHNPPRQHRAVPCALGQNLADTRVSPVHSLINRSTLADAEIHGKCVTSESHFYILFNFV